MVYVVLKLPFVYNMVNLLPNALYSAIGTDLANDELIKFTLPERKTLVYWLLAIGNDVF